MDNSPVSFVWFQGRYAEFLLRIVLQFLLGKTGSKINLEDHAKISADLPRSQSFCTSVRTTVVRMNVQVQNALRVCDVVSCGSEVLRASEGQFNKMLQTCNLFLNFH